MLCEMQCPGYDTKPSDGEVPVILELWEMQSTSDKVLYTSQIELNCVLMLN